MGFCGATSRGLDALCLFGLTWCRRCAADAPGPSWHKLRQQKDCTAFGNDCYLKNDCGMKFFLSTLNWSHTLSRVGKS